MKRIIAQATKLLALGLTLTLPAHATVYRTFETKRLAEVERAVAELTQKIDPAKILIATDLDNTLLSTDTDIGSEHWYMWQKALIEGGTNTFPAVAKTVPDMLRVQDILTFVQKMHPTAAGLPAFYSRLQLQGVARIVLTSRGPSTHDATLREIERNRIPLSPAAELDLAPGAVPGFDQGVYLTAGQHKGEALKAFLKSAGRKFDAVIFTDDRPHHVEGMNQAFVETPERLLSIRFTPVIDEITDFNRGDKRTVIAQWCEIAGGLRGGFPTLALNVEFNHCAESRGE